MARYAIIANGFSGATLPLANQLSLMGYKIDVFYIVFTNTGCIESLDFDETIKNKKQIISKSNNIYKYLDTKVTIFLLPILKRRLRLEKYQIGKVIPLINKYKYKKWIREILGKHYDGINLIIHSTPEVEFFNQIIRTKINLIITYHEVLKNLAKYPCLKDVVKQTAFRSSKIVVHSEKTKSDLINTGKVPNVNVNLIHFGAFESFLSYNNEEQSNEGDYILYLGHIHPYKGIRYLYDAVQIAGDKLKYKVMVAGGGRDEIISVLKGDSRFIVKNYFIPNEEMVHLIKKAIFIVCPYIAASQSGLVQTAMVFNKPVVATKVGAFTEIISDGINGLLVNPADANDLAQKMIEATNRTFEPRKISSQYEWNYIAEQYIELFNK